MKLAETNNLTCRMCKSRKKKVRITLLNKTSSAKLQHFISHQQQQRTGDDTGRNEKHRWFFNEMQRKRESSSIDRPTCRLMMCTHFPLESIYVLNNSDIKLNGISFSFMRFETCNNTMFAFYLFQLLR
jgi:hypothetical protein